MILIQIDFRAQRLHVASWTEHRNLKPPGMSEKKRIRDWYSLMQVSTIVVVFVDGVVLFVVLFVVVVETAQAKEQSVS